MNFIIFSMSIIFLLMPNLAYSKIARLSDVEIERLKVIKEDIKEVETKSIHVLIKELEKAENPSMNLDIKEAMAKTYKDIVVSQHVEGKGKKEWLYSMVALNMAFLQFAGQKDSAGGAQNLNKLIRFKLKNYLPADIYQQKGFYTSIE